MNKLSEEEVHFFQSQGFVVVSTIDKKGYPHNSCKGIIEIDKEGRVYLLDLYRGNTYANLKRDPRISITAVDEHKFKGYCLKGKAKIVAEEKLESEKIKAWETRLSARITQRLLKNLREEKGHPRHPEALLPKPEYMLVMEVEEAINLAPSI